MREKIKWLWRYYRHFPYVLTVLLVLTPLQGLFQVYTPRLMQYSIDFIKTGTAPDGMVIRWIVSFGLSLGLRIETILPVSFIALGFVAFVMYTFLQSHRAWMNRRLDYAFRQDAFERMTDKGPDFFNRFRTGDLVTRLTDDVDGKLSWFACSGIFRMYEAVITIVFTVTMMILMNPWLTLITAGPLPVFIFIFFKSSKLLDKRYDHLQQTISRLNAVMEACFSGIRVVKAYVQEKVQREKFAQAIATRREAEVATIRVAMVVDSLYGYIWQLGVIVVLLAGGAAVIHAKLTVGELFAFVYYVTTLFFPMYDIGQFLVKSLQSAVSIDRLRELENVPPMVGPGGSRGNGSIAGDLQFDNVTFGFSGSERKILDDVTLTVRAGQTVALVGKVGAGKSWLVNLLPRLVDPAGGAVTLGGHDLREFNVADLRRNIGYVPQEPILFSDTIRNNIRFGRDDVSDTVMEWAIDVAQLKDEVATFPKGLDTPIGTRGMAISGGQKQRVALARALVGKPRILVLDDCTSALDSRTEAALWDRLHEVMPGMTAIIITHRPDTLERVDNIYVLDDGRVAESGRHAELIARPGLYARIYKRYQLEKQVTE